LDGKKLIRDQASGSSSNPEKVGIDLANTLKAQGAMEILEAIFKEART